MSLNLEMDEQPAESRFFSSDDKTTGDNEGDQVNGGLDDDDVDSEGGDQKCLTLRLLQRCLPWFQTKSVWEPSQGDLFKTQVVQEVKYPAVLVLLERPFCEFVFVFSSIFSILLLLFSEGFLLESRILWGVIHCNNFVYTFCVFGAWLEILVKAKYAKTKQGFNSSDTLFSLLGVIPIDIVILVIHILNDNDADVTNPVTPWITVSRLLYVFRLRNVFLYFAKWEDQLAYSDLKMFVIRTLVYGLFFIHLLACCWHRIACEPFTMSHFKMRPSQATADVCIEGSWITKLLQDKNTYNWNSPLLRHGWHVLVEHYFVSVYWAVVTIFRMGAGDIRASLTSEWEIAFTAVAQILAWIFVIAYIAGSLTSILVEMDTEKEKFLTRRFAIERYLDFSHVTSEVRHNVNRFYDYLWTRSRGIHNWDLVEQMPLTMKAEIYYDVNKFVLDQLPLLSNLDDAFLMNLSVKMKHNFFLRGEVLQRRGQNGSAMYYVINGHLDIMHEDETQVIAEIRSGSAIGELFLLQSYPVVATVRCGSECDIMVLRKEDCKTVLQMYPEYKTTLQKRVDSCLEQSGLLLALCDKHNEYSKAYKYLQRFRRETAGSVGGKESYFQRSYDMISTVLDNTTAYGDNRQSGGSDKFSDFDGLELDADMKLRLASMNSGGGSVEERRMTMYEVMAHISLAIEADVARATSLAKDLNIARPPLVVKAPTACKAQQEALHHNSSPAHEHHAQKVFSFSMMPKLFVPTGSRRSEAWKLWKSFVFVCILWVAWYYPYRFAFTNHNHDYLDYVSHIFDAVFLVDFILDTLQPVVLAHKTLEVRREIVAHKMKTWYFYIRIFSFLPLEYVLGPMMSLNRTNYLFYLLKFNRLLQFLEVMKFFHLFDTDTRIPPEFLFIFHGAVWLFYAIHAFAICFEVMIKHWSPAPNGEPIPVLDYAPKRFYEFVYYWACQILTGTGFGDFPLRDDYEIATTVIGLVFGASMIVYLNARLAAIMANSERRRVSFKQMFYCLVSFMRERRFVRDVSDRVRNYYTVQWQQHEGVLIPSDKSAIWDAPKTLFQSVAFAQAQKYVERIPLFMHCPEALIIEVCASLRQYIVPPGEVLQYPSDPTRELYIIVKGFCKVTQDGHEFGKLGEGNYFGLNGLIYGTNRSFCITTVNFCQVFCLEFNSFVEITKRYTKFLLDFKLLRGDATLPRGIELTISPEEWEVFPQFPPLRHRGDEQRHPPTTTPSSSLGTASSTDASSNSRSQAPPQENVVNMDTLEPAAQLPHEEEAVASLHVVTKTHRFYTFLQTAFLKSIIPHGKFLWIWTILRVFCAFLVGNFVPIQVSFSVDPAFAFGFILFFDIVAWVDLFICSRVAYYGPSNQLITSWTKTALHYMRGPFVLDFLGCLPLDLFLIIFTPQISMFGAGRTFANKYHVISCLRLNRMLQCYRLFVSGNLMKKSIFKSLSFLILLQVVPLMSFFLNVTTCLAVLSVCGTSLNGEPIRCEKWAWITNGEIYKDAPVSNSSVMEDPVISYIIGFYWVISSALCVGFGDIGAHGHETNRKIAITVIYMGVLVTGFLVSKLTACLVGEDSRRILIREKTKVLFRFLEQFGVPKELCRRAKEYYFGAWDKTKGIFPKDLFSALHPSLKSDVMKSLYQERLKLSPIFLSTDEPGIRILCSKLQEVFYPEGEFLFEYGDLSGDVYFIAKGLIATYTERGDIMSYVGTGSLIGEISCLFEVQRQYTSVAATDCEVYMFRKEDFLDFLSLYPNLKTTLEESCIRHYKETMEAAAKSAGVRVLMSPLDDKNDEAALRSDNVGTAGLEERLRDYASEGSRSVTTGQKSEADDDDITDMTLEMEGTKNLAVVEMDFGSAMEMAVEECERDPEFIYDPLRLPATSLEHERKGGRGAKGATSHGADTKHWTSYFVSFGKVPRDEMGLIHILQERRKAKWYGIVFHPLSPVCTWVSFYLFVTSLSCGLTAYEIAFHTPTEATNLLTLRICMEIFFVVRIFGNFHLGYYDPYGTVVSDSVKVIKRYICSPSGFFLDLVTTFPFYLISYLLRGQAGKDAEVAADIRGLQLLRVFLFARYLKETETNLRMRMSRVKIVKVTILLCFIFHFCACAWYLVACDGLDCRRGSWMSIFIKEMINNKKIRNGSEITIGSRYLLSLYYVTTAITFTGLSDITPRTKVELCSTITMIFTTVFIIGFLVGEMTQWLAAQVKTKIHFRHKLNVMEHHFLALGLSYPKLNSVRSYFRLLWLRCNGNPYTQILAELPYALRADITMKVYGLNIKNSRILGRLDDIIIRQLSVRVHHEIFMPGAHIIRAGAVCTAVYFIKKGEVVILDEKANMELCVDVLYENECFGEVKVLLPIKEQFQFSYVARLETEVGVLFGDDMVDVLLRHHGVLEEVIGRADRLKAQRLAKKDEEDRIGFSDSSSGVGQGRYSASDINLHRR